MDDVTERDNPISKINVGNGRISIERSAATESASEISDPGKNLLKEIIFDENLDDLRISSIAEEKLS